MSPTGNNEEQLLQRRKARLLVELQDINARLAKRSKNDQGGGSNHSASETTGQNIPPAPATTAARLMRTNGRIEKEQKLNGGRWFGMGALNPACWVFNPWGNFRRTAYSFEPRAVGAGAQYAGENDLHDSHLSEGRSLEVDVEASDRPDGTCNPPKNPPQYSDTSATSHQHELEEPSVHGPASGSVEGDAKTNDIPCETRHLKRTYAQMEYGPARPFASSLESLSSCDMSTIHAMADPHLRVELTTSGQYCAAMKSQKKGGTKKCGGEGRETKKRKLGAEGVKEVQDNDRDYFDDYCSSVFPKWNSCKELATAIIDADDDEMVKRIGLYSDAARESDLYDPFEFLCNRILERARQAASAEEGVTPDSLPNLVAVPAHSRPMIGCAADRKPDFVVMDVPQGSEVPSPVDARDARFIIEMKFGKVEKGRPPKLHDRESGSPICSTFGGEAASPHSTWTPLEQMLDYNCVGLAAQGPTRQYMFGMLITFMRLQIMYADRAGCMIAKERNFSRDFGVLFAVLIGLYNLEVQRAALQPGITMLSRSDATPLEESDFTSSDIEVTTGTMTNISRPIAPLRVLVQLASARAEHVNVFAHGVNLMERPMAIDWKTPESSVPPNLADKVLRPRQSAPRLAKSKGLERNKEIAVEESSNNRFPASSPRQFAPRCIFGSGLARYRCILGANTCGITRCTLQMSWQPRRRLSEATVLRIANENNMPGVPTLVGSKDIADTGGNLVRLRIQHKFAGLPSIWPVDNVLRAIVLKEHCIPLSSIGNTRDFLSALLSILKAIIRLEMIGIMHTNISEANMMVLHGENAQGVLVGFEFTIVDKRRPESKRVRSDSLRASAGREATGSMHKSSPSTGEPFVNSVTHHVACLPLDRCSDHPPVHQFQHELESFLWSIFFILSGFRGGRRIVNRQLENWYTGDWGSIISKKRDFLGEQADSAPSAAQFATSLGANPQPLVTCSQRLVGMLRGSASKQLDAARILSVLQEALDAYT